MRRAAAADRDWILSQAPRLHEFGPPPWRPRAVMDAAVARSIADTLDHATDDAIVLVAEDERGRLVGFIHMCSESDFFTAERHAHVSDLVVARDGEGRGVGRALLEAGERWARERGYRLVTLNVFRDNERARALYERAGYVAEITKFTKVIDPSR
jgi:ribosomal protein S18 acetylase RimI-like enzyme